MGLGWMGRESTRARGWAGGKNRMVCVLIFMIKSRRKSSAMHLNDEKEKIK